MLSLSSLKDVFLDDLEKDLGEAEPQNNSQSN